MASFDGITPSSCLWSSQRHVTAWPVGYTHLLLLPWRHLGEYRLINAANLVQLFVLCFPECSISIKLKPLPSGTQKLQVGTINLHTTVVECPYFCYQAFCEHCDFTDLLPLIREPDKETAKVSLHS